MHNLELLTGEQEIEAYTEGLWKTETFRKSQRDPRGYIRREVERFKKAPRIFYTMDKPELEKTHFTAWMNAIAHRQYENPAIHDLYYLHEIVHTATLTWNPEQTFEEFIRAVWRNEMEASLQSEVFTYFELPDFRPQSFAFEIWADRYLTEQEALEAGRSNLDLFAKDRAGLVAAFTRERIRAMEAPKAGDKAEGLIHKYSKVNNAWAAVWKTNWIQVETALAAFQAMAGIDRRKAVEDLAGWLVKMKAGQACPFEREAGEFAVTIEKTMKS